MNELRLEALDGTNPLAFFAALGVLNALTDCAEGSGSTLPRLRFCEAGTWYAVLETVWEEQRVLDLLGADLEQWKEEPVVRLEYDRGKGKLARDLKPPPRAFRSFLCELFPPQRADAEQWFHAERSLAFAAAFATEAAEDKSGNTKPTALHFTAGQQEFLAMVKQLIEGNKEGAIGEDDFREALFGPWQYQSTLPVLQWDATATRYYALRASDPSNDKKTGVAAADWLAFRGLSFFPTFPVADRIQTTGCRGPWKRGSFVWPLWTSPMTRAGVRSTLAQPWWPVPEPVLASTLEPVQARRILREHAKLVRHREQVLRARGIAIVLQSKIRRSDQGGYGSFSPSRVV